MLYNDSTGVAYLRGSRKARPFAASPALLQFTDLRIDLSASNYRLRFRVFANSTEILDVSGQNGISNPFFVTVGEARKARATVSLAAAGNGSCSVSRSSGTKNSTYALSIRIRMNRTGFFTGYLAMLSSASAGNLFGGPQVISNHDDVAGTIAFSPSLMSEQTAFDTICKGQVAYKIYTPAGYNYVDLAGADFWPAANGRYEASSVLLYDGRPVYKQVAHQNNSLKVTGAYAGVYGKTEFLYAGKVTYRLDGGGRFLRTPNNQDVDSFEVANELGGAAVGIVSSSSVQVWDGFHILFYNETSSLWAVRRFVEGGVSDVEGVDILLLSLTPGTIGWGCIGCRNIAAWNRQGDSASSLVQLRGDGSWISASHLSIQQWPAIIAIDSGGNMVGSIDTAASEYSITLSQSATLSIQESLGLAGAQVSTTFSTNEGQYALLAWPTLGKLSNSSAAEAIQFESVSSETNTSKYNVSLGAYSVDASIFQWSSKSARFLHIIDNGNLRGGVNGTACPSGWVCSGTVSAKFNRSTYPLASSRIEPPRCVERAVGTGWSEVYSQAAGYLSLLGASVESNQTTTCTGPSGLVRFYLHDKNISNHF